MRTIRGLRKSLKDGYKTDLPFDDHIHIYRHEGVDYLVNGHHRKAASELNGNTNLKTIYITTEELAEYGVTPVSVR